MITVLILILGVAALVAYEVGADRKVRRSTAGAAPVVIVRGMAPRWWRRAARTVTEWAVSAAILGGLLVVALRMPHEPRHDFDPGPAGTAAPAASPTATRTPAHSAPGGPGASPTSANTTPKGH